jgi:uncharacterized protein YkwD
MLRPIMKSMKQMNSVILSLSVSALVFLSGCAGQEFEDGMENDGTVADVDEEQVGEAESELVTWCNDTLAWNSNWASLEDKVVTLVNQKRAATNIKCGGVPMPSVPPLIKDARVRCAARMHSKDMSDRNFFGHVGKNGWKQSQRMTKAGYTSSRAGENINRSWTTPAEVVTSWMQSENHCKRIMDGDYKHIGVGYSYNVNADDANYWTMDVGKP